MEDNNKGCFLVVTTILIVTFFSILALVELGTKKSFQGYITDRIIDRGNTYLVIKSTDGIKEVFENKDNLFFGKYNSNDLLANMEIGVEYNFTVSGWRVPHLSWFRNIISFEPVD